MRYFLTLYRLRLKASLCSPVIIVTASFFLALTLTFAALLPVRAPAVLSIGVAAQGETAEAARDILLENGDYTVLPYTDVKKMRADILSGKLHCGYEIGDEWDFGKPVTVYDTQSSYLRPLLDQLVLSSCFEARLPYMTQEYLEKLGCTGKDAKKLLAEQRLEANTMTVELRAVGKGSALPENARSVQPLLYAVLVSLFLAVAVIGVLLVPGAYARAQGQLAAMSGHRLASMAAPALASLTLYLAVLLAADGALSILWGEGQYYPVMARVTLLPFLAALAALPTLTAGFLRRWAAVITVVIPPWLLVSVVCSGALADPATFPMGLGILRFLSPAWYALRWLAAF